MHCEARDHRGRMNKHLYNYRFITTNLHEHMVTEELFKIQTAAKFYFLSQYFKKCILLIKNWNYSTFVNPISFNRTFPLEGKYYKRFLLEMQGFQKLKIPENGIFFPHLQ